MGSVSDRVASQTLELQRKVTEFLHISGRGEDERK
jgi:hypothetical protein